MEEPAFMAEAGDLAGRRILDLGCGDGTFGQRCLDAGASSYRGLDGSRLMIERANDTVVDDRASFAVADLEDFAPLADPVDLVSSRMALHYLASVEPVFAAARSSLEPGGRIVVTVLHPVISAGNKPSDGPRQTQEVDRYFDAGPRERDWFGRDVAWFHRTIEQYVDAVIDAGFAIERIRECEPVADLFDGDEDELERRRRVPLFLLIAATAR